MTDLERLDEALERWSADLIVAAGSGTYAIERTEAATTIVAAARAYRALLANRERVVYALLVEHSDDGRPLIPPHLLVGDRLIKSEPHSNGVLFELPIDQILLVDHPTEEAVVSRSCDSTSTSHMH